MPSISPTSFKNPVTPSIFNSGIPPALEEMTGNLQAMASNAANPKLSVSEGNKNKSETESISSTASNLPKNLTLSFKFNSRTNCSTSLLSGPSPANNNFAGICSTILANIFTTSGTLFTFLKLEVCTIIFSSFGAMAILKWFCALC